MLEPKLTDLLQADSWDHETEEHLLDSLEMMLPLPKPKWWKHPFLRLRWSQQRSDDYMAAGKRLHEIRHQLGRFTK